MLTPWRPPHVSLCSTPRPCHSKSIPLSALARGRWHKWIVIMDAVTDPATRATRATEGRCSVRWAGVPDGRLALDSSGVGTEVVGLVALCAAVSGRIAQVSPYGSHWLQRTSSGPTPTPTRQLASEAHQPQPGCTTHEEQLSLQPFTECAAASSAAGGVRCDLRRRGSTRDCGGGCGGDCCLDDTTAVASRSLAGGDQLHGRH
mmetsp:Transcript_58980/g.131466  ORF Transcript_58980/g.131466 Transcript_58980/m.131466 type:complete len:203 (+) Transcript_58980:132-740(+)